jgi:hypothetical protein
MPRPPKLGVAQRQAGARRFSPVRSAPETPELTHSGLDPVLVFVLVASGTLIRWGFLVALMVVTCNLLHHMIYRGVNLFAMEFGRDEFLRNSTAIVQ